MLYAGRHRRLALTVRWKVEMMSYKFLPIAVLLFHMGYGYADAPVDTTFKSLLDSSSIAVVPIKLNEQTLNAVAMVDQRIVAAGWRGLVIYSDDLGNTWKQAEVPVQVDLTAVFFDGQGTGWVAGHDQVILQSRDRGTTWQKVFDNRQAAALARTHYGSRAGEDRYQALSEQALANTQEDWSLPILDLRIDQSGHGYAVGNFGTVHVTADAGKTWLPGYEYVDNQRFLNLNALAEINGALHMTGEGGLVYRLDPQTHEFSALETGYEGSFYGMVGDSRNLYAFGLRGTLYHSAGVGTRWRKIETGSSGLFVSAIPAPGRPGHFLLFSFDGHVFELGEDGALFRPVEVPQPINYIDAAAVGGDLITLVGKQGVQVMAYRDGALQRPEARHE